MRARTLVFLAVFLCVFAPTRALAAPYIIAQYSGLVPPYDSGYMPDIGLNYPQFMVATGTLSDLFMPVASIFGFGGDKKIGMRLLLMPDNVWLDCESPVKTVDEWGIPHEAGDPMAPMTDFGPFTGSQCDIPDWDNSWHIVSVVPVDENGQTFSNISGMGSGGNMDFTEYAGGVPVPAATASSVLFIPGMEASRLYMREPDGSERQLWEPSWHTDIPLLAMNPDGTSVNEVYTRDMVGALYDNNDAIEGSLARTFSGNGLEVYGHFEKFLDNLVSTNVIKEWRAYPYDWRYDPLDVVANGTLTEQPDGTLKTIYLDDVLKEMAANSPTGKVTIVAHSNGGLVAKGLAASLGADAPNYIDRIILVGVPQYGTPQDVGAILHGDGETLPGYGLNIIMDGFDVRALAHDMPDAYDLLPSSAYFDRVANPVATFDSSAPLSGAYANAYGAALTSIDSFDNFLTDTSSLNAQSNPTGDSRTPQILSAAHLSKASILHTALDNWTPPAGITVTAIAGWGQATTEGLAYTDDTSSNLSCSRASLFSPATCSLTPRLSHTAIQTDDGDDVVIDASAIGNVTDSYYFNTKEYPDSIGHQNLLSATPIQAAISNLLDNQASAMDSTLSRTRPTGGYNPLTIISVSPATPIIATDEDGNQTAIVPIPNTDFSIKKQDASGATIDVADDEEHVSLPQSATYSVTIGAATSTTQIEPGIKTIRIEQTQLDGTATTTATYTVPMFASTTVDIAVGDGAANAPTVDRGDGTPPYTMATDTPTLDISSVVTLLQQQIDALTVRSGIKNRLLRALQELNGVSANNLADAQESVSGLETLIEAQTGVKLSPEQGASMLQLIDNLKLWQ